MIFFTFICTLPINTYAQVIHETRYGDNLSKISKDYNVNKDDLAKLNGLAKNAQLVLGQPILIPGSTYVVQTR